MPTRSLFIIKVNFIQKVNGMKRKVATPAGTARAEDTGLSVAKEAAEAGPAESVHLERNDLENGMFLDSLELSQITFETTPFLFSKWPLRQHSVQFFVFPFAEHVFGLHDGVDFPGAFVNDRRF